MLNRLRNRWALLLILAAALVGFFLLINQLGTLTTSGPDDLLAPAPSEEEYILLPSGAGMITLLVVAAGVVLGLFALAAPHHWTMRGRIPVPRRSVVLGAVAGLAVAGLAVYVATSGLLDQNLPYDEHEARRLWVEPRGIAVLAAFFLSLVVVGIVRPRLILLHLATWLVLSLIFGFFGSASLAGLNLFHRTERAPQQEAYAAEVERLREPRVEQEVLPAIEWDVSVPLGNGNAALIRDASILLEPGTAVQPVVMGIPNPLFQVSGAVYTSLLRSATGDVYEDGEWTQLDPVTWQNQPGADIPGSILALVLEARLAGGRDTEGSPPQLLPQRAHAELLAQPSNPGGDLNVDHISVSPAGEFETFVPGVLPISAVPLEIGVEGSWRPFSSTFESVGPLPGYSWTSLVAEFGERELDAARPVNDQVYLSLPTDTPQRVRDLAVDITRGIESAYGKSQAIEMYLESEYEVAVVEPGERFVLPPDGADPVDWFLFEQRAGGATAFSSAFVVLARAVGVPARVVSGWAISPTAEWQIVHGHQAHQWAEIALEDFGWITVDPTPGLPSAPGSAPGLDAGGLETGIPSREESEDQLDTAAPSEDLPLETEGGDSPWEISALENLTLSKDPDVRAEAAIILGEIASLPALEGLANAAFNDPDEDVRRAAIEGASLADFDLLVRILQEHPDALLRMAAAAGLGEKGDPRALPPLAGSLKGDASPDVRAAAAEALGELEADGAIPSLEEALADDANAAVRAAAASAIGEVGDQESISALSTALTGDESSLVRQAVAEALGEIGGEQAADSLAESLVSDQEAQVRVASAEALSEIREPEALPALVQARDGDQAAEVRSASSNALQDYSLSDLTGGLRDSPSAAVRSSAAELLGERGNPAAAPDLIEAMNDRAEEVREAAAEAVEKLGNITPLENGSGLLAHASGVSLVPGTTTQQAGQLPHTPVFIVRGAGEVDFLRTAVGDRYADGEWLRDEQTEARYLPGGPVNDPGPPTQITTSATGYRTSRLTVEPPEGEETIPRGIVPISLHREGLSIRGTLYHHAETFVSDRSEASYEWDVSVPSFSQAQLDSARPSSSYSHASLPDGLPDRIGVLAREITSGRTSPYQMAKAIEQYLRSNYTYGLADTSSQGVPSGEDPVDWFLFESREGTCGSFSSAFVLLARSVGLTARVVSGWAISPEVAEQTVYANQAHQRAEVAFEGLGWIPFEPTASGGPADRTPEPEEIEQQQREAESEEFGELSDQLASGDAGDEQDAQQALEALGAEVSETETGSKLVTRNGGVVGMAGGTTTSQAGEPISVPVFLVSGAAHTPHIRTAVGDLYANGAWRQLDPLSLPYVSGASVPHLVRSEVVSGTAPQGTAPERKINPALLSGFEVETPRVSTDTIRISPIPGFPAIPAGAVPISLFPDSMGARGEYRPFSLTFSLASAVPAFEWVAQIPHFSEAQLNAAEASTDPTYTQLPTGLPGRIRELALEITSGRDSTYAKARALEQYLKTQYTYNFADASGSGTPPPGQDPVDWFLFDHREGTCGVFSSAFVVLARSVGIPARVVSGWSINPVADQQQVRSDQAHQWAEVALQGVGWVTFDPTASGGAPTRVDLQPDNQAGPPEGTQAGPPEGTQAGPPEGTQAGPPQGAQAGPPQGAQAGPPQGTQAGPPQGAQAGPPAGTQAGPPEGMQAGPPAGMQAGPPEGTQAGPPEGMKTGSPEGTQAGPPEGMQTGSPEGTQAGPPEGIQTGPPEGTQEEESPQQAARQELRPVETTTDITIWSPEIRRRASFTVGGTVRTSSGRSVDGVEVEVYINETKEHGGILIGTTTASNGSFRAEVKLPASMPRGPYQLLARAVENERYLESWSDPDVTVYSESGLELTGPQEVAVDSPAVFSGRFRDDTGSGVPDIEMEVKIDGRELPNQSTGPAGEFSFAHTFLETGPHTVEIEFDEQDFLLGNALRLDLTAVMPTRLTLEPLGKVKVGEEFTIGGILRNARGEAMSGEAVNVRVADGPEEAVVTDTEGSFSASGSVGEVGEFPVYATYAGDQIIQSSEASTRVSAQHATSVSVSGPSTVTLGGRAFIGGRMLSATQPEIGPQSLSVWDGDGNFLVSISTDEDGVFEYFTDPLADAGPQSFTFAFEGTADLTPTSAGFSLVVLAPTTLIIEGPDLVMAGDTIELTGELRQQDGQPVPLASVWVAGRDTHPLVTDTEGGFTWEFPVEADLDESVLEETVNLSFGFDGTDHLAPTLRNHAITVGIPWLMVEPTEAVARGETATLRGTVLLGSRPLADEIVTMDQGIRAATTGAGTFVIRYPVAHDTPLGRIELPASVQGLNLEAFIPLDVKSRSNLLVVPLDKVRPGEEVLLQLHLSDDKGAGIPGAVISSSQGHREVTDDTGTVLVTLTVPDSEGLLAVPVTFNYEGDDLRMPLSYFAGVPVTPTSFNWLLWVVMPGLLVVVAALAYTAQRGRQLVPTGGLLFRIRRRQQADDSVVAEEPPAVEERDVESEPEPGTLPEPVATRLDIIFAKPAADLPDVWAIGESVAISVRLTTDEGAGIPRQSIRVSHPDGTALQLETDSSGGFAFDWTADSLGEFTVSAHFEADDFFLDSSDSRSLRIVDFREEIIDLYNQFVDWADEAIPGVRGRTPREVEASLVRSGEPMDHRAVDEVVSRFEEADYSEHPIGRRQYESMYRAWRTVVEE